LTSSTQSTADQGKMSLSLCICQFIDSMNNSM